MTVAVQRVNLEVERPRTLAGDAWRRLTANRISRWSLIIVGLYVVVGLIGFAPFTTRAIERQLSVDKSYAPPSLFLAQADGTKKFSLAAAFGLDIEGRSVLWEVAYGTRIALLIMVFTSVLSISIGVVLGLLAGYFGGWVDDLVTWLYSTVSSVPWLLLVIAMAYVLQNVQMQNPDSFLGWLGEKLGGLPTVVLSLGLTDWVGLCRLIRGEVIKVRDLDFVTAARAVGLKPKRILLRHVLPSTFHIVVITFSLGSVAYVQMETVLAFLGLGITNEPSWGKMIDDSKLELLQGRWWEFAAATIAILILSLALNAVGDALRDALDPKLHGVK
jgi:peptide/nickel transport system permease protein